MYWIVMIGITLFFLLIGLWWKARNAKVVHFLNEKEQAVREAKAQELRETRATRNSGK